MQKTINMLFLFNLMFAIGVCGCNFSGNDENDKPTATEADNINDANKMNRKEMKKSNIEKHLEVTRKLMEIAQKGTDENIKYVRLTPENNYSDPLPDGYLFTRDFTSGPGTGKFMGSNMEFEFTRGNCKEADNPPDDGRKKRRWYRKKLNPCQEKLLENEWCARIKEDHSVSYTIYFLSWSIKNKTCVGDCEEHDNMTSYIRIRNQ